MDKRILVTGSKGQLGNELKKIAARNTDHHWFFTDIDELDITRYDQVSSFFRSHKIDICINCAAYTAVDEAEENARKAREVNAEAVKILADVCFLNKALLIHLSTDYVFDGAKKTPYNEQDETNPISVYGKSKALGEKVLQLHAVNSVIIRSSWLYAAEGHNFVKTIMRIATERDTISVVNDQFGSPTWAADLAAVIWQITQNQQLPVKEIYHYSNMGNVSWFDFALEIIRLAKLKCEVQPLKTDDYPSKAVRPFYSVLNTSKVQNFLGINIPDWKASLAACVDEIRNSSSYEIS